MPTPPSHAAPRSKGRGAALFGVGFVLIVAAWLLGVTARLAQRQAPLPPPDVAPPAQFGLYGEAWDYVNSEFYGDRPDPAVITDGAVEGMVEALDDPWALVATPVADAAAAEAAPNADDPLAPRFLADLGLWAADTSAGARVLAVVPNSPADAAGIVADDLIVRAVNGADEGVAAHATPTPAATLAAPADGGRNPVTSGDRALPVMVSLSDPTEPSVEVVVSRDDTSLFARSLKRTAAPPSPPITATLAMGILRVRLPHLAPGATEALDAALSQALAAGGAAPSRIVLDLRDNPGGSRAELASVAGRFMRGTVWIQRSRAGDEPAEDVPQAAVEPAQPNALSSGDVVVLVNGGTGDEAEMLSAALRDARGARLVGQPTFGHGTLQSLLTVGRVQIRLTTGTWLSPKGTAVAAEGLTPDVVVEGRSAQDAAAATLGADAAAPAVGAGG